MSDDTIKMPVDVSCILHLLPHRLLPLIPQSPAL